MAESKDSLPTAGDNDADANPEGMTATEWDTFVGEHLAKREAERAAAHEEEVEALRRQPIAKVARRLADNFAHFVEALEHPDTSPEDRALYGSWVLHVASADWNDAPPQNTKLDHLFRSIHLGEVLVKHGYWRIYIRRPRGEPVPHVPCRRGYGVVARWYRAPPNWRERATAWRADKLAHAARFVVKDFAAVFPYDAAALDLTHLAVALDEWTTPGSDRKKRGGRRANRVGKFNALEDAIAETSFAQKAASLEVRYAQWRATKRVMKSKA